MKVALVYDRVNKWGGAERVLLALHEMFPKAPLYTAVYDSKKAPWAKVFPEIKTSFLQNIPFLKDKHELLGTFMPFAFESFNFDEYDLVISVTSEAAKGIITKPPTKHICYCLTPTRYLWSHHDLYFKNRILKLLSRPAVFHLRKWDKIAAQRPDKMIGISSAVQKRIKKYYNRESQVIFPPLSLLERLGSVKKDYYLVVSRLIPYKRVDLVVDVFSKLDKQLIIVGTGGKEKGLKSMSRSKNIVFKGQISDRELVRLYKGAKALIMPQEEDFGLVAVEAMSYGTPVVAYKKGGALDIITENTGVFFKDQNRESLTKAIEKLEKRSFNSDKMVEHAKKFSEERFKKEFRAYINKP